MRLILKPFLITSLIFVFFQISAQEIGIKGGLNFSTLNYYWQNEDWSDQYSARLGLQLGAMAKLPLSEKYSINTGLMFVQRKHLSEVEIEPDNVWESEPNKCYLEIPVLFRREFDLGKIMLFGEIGPYAGIGLKVSEDYKHYIDDELVQRGSYSTDWGNGEYNIKRFDAGLNFALGVLINKLELGFSYAHGFINTQNVDYREQKNRAFFINCAYPLFLFNKEYTEI